MKRARLKIISIHPVNMDTKNIFEIGLIDFLKVVELLENGVWILSMCILN